VKPPKSKPPKAEPVVRSPSQLGAALLRFRKLISWTQREAGERAGIKQAMVSLVESGSSGTKLATLFKLLAGLDLELIVRKRRKA
jgi:HTH-type transcriptional regulator/antitoxin HipB